MKKVEIYDRRNGILVACYEINPNGRWVRFSEGIEIEEIEQTNLYNVVFGSSSRKEKFFYIIEA